MIDGRSSVHTLIGAVAVLIFGGCSDTVYEAVPADYGNDTILHVETKVNCDAALPYQTHEKRVHDVWSLTFMNKRTGLILGIVAIGIESVIDGCDIAASRMCVITQTYRHDISILDDNHDIGIESLSDGRKAHALFQTWIRGPEDIGGKRFLNAPQLEIRWELYRSKSGLEVAHGLESMARFFPRWPGNDLAILPSQDDRANNFDDLLKQGVNALE